MGKVKALTAARKAGKPVSHLYRAVHAAVRANGMDDEDRKAIMAEKFGKHSMSDMTTAEITQLLNHLNRARNQQSPAGHRAHVGKIRALWWSLYWLGEVESSDERAISAFVKRQTGVSALRFVDHKSGRAVIEGLKAWLTRVGVEWPGAELLASMQGQTAQLERKAVLEAILGKLLNAGLLGVEVWHEFAGTIPMHEWAQDRSTQEFDNAIRYFGQLLREGN